MLHVEVLNAMRNQLTLSLTGAFMAFILLRLYLAVLSHAEVAKLTLFHVVTSKVQRLICTGSFRVRSTDAAVLT